MSEHNNDKKERVREIDFSLTLFLLFIFLFFIAVIQISACSLEAEYYLEVIHRYSQEILLSVQVYPEENFYLEYTNSRDLNPIIDVFRVGKAGYFYTSNTSNTEPVLHVKMYGKSDAAMFELTNSTVTNKSAV